MSDVCRTHCHRDHAAAAPARLIPAGLDRLAALLSSLCLVHCVAIPVAVALLPALALVVPDLPWLHGALLALAVPASGLALWRGWRIHRDRAPALTGLAGLTLMAGALMMVPNSMSEVALTVGGGLLVATGHLLNLRAGAGPRR